MLNFHGRNSQRGQALLIVVLIMVVALTVGISLASRNVVNLKLSTEEQNSKMALSAAEAGIEEALIGKNATNQQLGNAVVSNVNIQQSAGNLFLINNGAIISKDDGVDVWLTPFNENITQLYQNPWTGNLTVVWGSGGDICDTNPAVNTMAALEIIVISGSAANPQMTQSTYDYCRLRSSNNGFTAANLNNNISVGGVKPAYTTNPIAVTNGLFVRIIPLYANTVIGVQASSNLPSQGQIITSTGTAGTTQRKISYFQTNDSLPSEFFYSIFSPKSQ